MTDLATLRLQRHVERLIAPWNGPGRPGITVGVVRDDALVIHRQAGLASVELDVPIGPDTCFRIASVSKQFTCLAVLMLAEQGKLALEDEVQGWLPELPRYAQRITIAHLMHNTSGIRDMLELMRLGGADLSHACTRTDLLEAICRQQGLNFEPGTRYRYSNSNFLLLGLIVERISGASLPDFLEHHIFTPAGMNATRMVESTTQPVRNLATGYLPSGASWVRAVHGFPLGGEGGLVSCVQDLALWHANLASGLVGGPALMQALVTQTPFANGMENHYARGLQVAAHRGVNTISHGGLWPGYKTEFLRAPALGLAVIVISNDGASDPYHLGHAVLDAAIEGRPEVHPVPALPALPAAGRYVDRASGTAVELSHAADGTPIGATNGLSFRLITAADGRMRASRGARDFTAELSPDGATLAVEADAGVTGIYHRVTALGTLPADLPGDYSSVELACVWHIFERDGAMLATVQGPLVSAGPWEIEPIEGDILRLYTPSNLYRVWQDVRVLRGADGGITGLNLHGNRAHHIVLTRMVAGGVA